VRTVEAYFRDQLKGVEQVVNVRGRGFLLGLEFADAAKAIHEALLDRRIITGTSSDAKVLRLLPPLCLGKEEVDLFIKELSESLSSR
jgi:acetylornithine/succinyldiaminopimelate/putrescine aminotransferase